jgi:hypothetical protein
MLSAQLLAQAAEVMPNNCVAGIVTDLILRYHLRPFRRGPRSRIQMMLTDSEKDSENQYATPNRNR